MRRFIATSALLLLKVDEFFESCRYFNVIQRGNDREVKSLFALLGFGKDSESHRISRTSDDLRRGYLLEAMKLKDPQHNVEDAVQLSRLRKAFLLLSDDGFRSRYAAHHCSSPDALLHVKVEGGQIAANHNPEHQSFEFVDHALSSVSGVQRSFGDFTKSFQFATESFNSSFSARPHNPTDTRTAQNGDTINVMLCISFDESILGCTKRIEYEKNITCNSCQGYGRSISKKTRKCPQCRGRGSIHLPSATYHIEKTCGYCDGDGTAPQRRCTACKGAGVQVGHKITIPVEVFSGTTTMTTRRLRGKGHDGVRGGKSGDLMVTIMVQEHSIFHRDGLDIHMLLPISLSTALLGGVVMVPTLHAKKPLHIPPCVHNGQRLTLEGCGVVDGTAQTLEKLQHRGNLHVHLLVVMPSVGDLTGEQRRTLEEFSKAGDGAVGTAEEETPATLKRRYREWLVSSR